jgi:hypothetical protein
MAWSLDARIPLVTVSDPAALAAALAEGKPAAVLAAAPPPALPDGAVTLAGFDLSGPAHAASCTCCGGRTPAALALDRLFQARVRGTCAWFDRVIALVATDAARRDLDQALGADPVTISRFRAA